MIKITIGIPALNEERNIGQLLQSILDQERTEDYFLDKVTVVSDGSTDKTVPITNNFAGSLPLQIIINPVRIGQALSQNKIFELSTSDYILLLNADILPADKNFLSEIAKQVSQHAEIDFWGIDVKPIPSSNLFESIINSSHTWKTQIYKTINKHDNLYLCHGRARVFSSRLYKTLRWPPTIGEDAYSYLYAKKYNYKFRYLDTTYVVFRSPQSLKEHLKQSVRFLNSTRSIENYFGEKFIKRHYHISTRNIIFPSIIQFMSKPFHTVAYICILVIAKTKALFSSQNTPLWQISEDSKQLHLK